MVNIFSTNFDFHNSASLQEINANAGSLEGLFASREQGKLRKLHKKEEQQSQTLSMGSILT